MKLTVIGGGVSGLSAAWHLRQSLIDFPSLQIQILEKDRVGGWIRTARSNNLILEEGPRTLRPHGSAGSATLSMVYRLGLAKDVVSVAKSSDAAKKRFIWHKVTLNELPSTLMGFLLMSPPVTNGLILSLLKEPFVKKASATDESIESFVVRRFGRSVSDNLVSAVVHGIYAGDISTLSVRSTMRFLWDMEHKYGSVVGGIVSSLFSSNESDRIVSLLDDASEEFKFIRNIKDTASIYSFKNGLQTLTDCLYDTLKNDGVEFINSSCTGLTYGNNLVNIQLSDKTELQSDYVVCAIPSNSLSKLLPDPRARYLFGYNPFVTVAVVNLVYTGSVLPVSGFGYLVPKSECRTTDVIGCIFDSCAMPEQEATAGKSTRLTVMMGGHLFQSKFGDAQTCSHQSLLDVAVKTVQMHLGVSPDLLIDSHVSIHRDCIPQYLVGHEERLSEMKEVMKRDFDGRVLLAGSSYMGVGVNDCVLSAINASDAICGMLSKA